ncbi:DUF1521 domain-containing protein [Hyalangium versicolor]|uniref:DUF1521 domain-containing protein n=1 Tax=Hyalangium versicolor TaxID=2861190 RepID=UPI001CCC36F7|nr:DUF1521 domain-containing protein [Hyalangium versicolor]
MKLTQNWNANRYGTPGTGHGGAPTGPNRCMNSFEAQMVQAVIQATINVNINVQGDGFHPPRNVGDVCGCNPRPCFPQFPSRPDSCHPQGSLKADPNGTVTTPGGYTIKQNAAHDWTITGPDGKNTRVWGDPHVEEGDGGKWDFKRNSTFVLGDGTRINVGTKPAGNGMTMTDNLEIISGNDRVKMTGFDQPKGQTSPVTHDGFAHANSFGNNDVFVMGRETDDWSLGGREIVGSNNGGETFNVGNALPAGAQTPRPSWPHGGAGHVGGRRRAEPEARCLASCPVSLPRGRSPTRGLGATSSRISCRRSSRA